MQMLRRRGALLISLLFCVLASAADWPQWRGPSRDGKSAETALLASWPAGGPRLIWKTQGLGEGYSPFAVVGSRLYTQGQQGDQQFVLALDVNTGKQLWKTPSGRSFREGQGNGPRGTPTIDGDRLYALASDGMLVCLEIGTGKRIWGIQYRPALRWQRSEVGIHRIAVDRRRSHLRHARWPGCIGGSAKQGPREILSGNRRMTPPVIPRQSPSMPGGSAVWQHSPPVPPSDWICGMGALLWQYPKVANDTANIATPIVYDGYVFVSTDYGTGCALLKLTPEGGGVKASEVYFNRDMRNHYTTSVLLGDYLYGFSSSILTAMNFKTGKVA